jgi:hypothetical protein
VLTALVVVIFAVTKFTEGAWLIVIIGPAMVFALIRLNREYRMENRVLETISGRQPPPLPHYSRRTVLVFVDSFDLATLAALRYARSLRPSTLRAVHFVIDSARADQLRRDWTAAERAVVLEFVDCPDRRLTRAAADLVCQETADPGTHVTVILPRRSYSPLLGRFLHDRTADKIARVVSLTRPGRATVEGRVHSVEIRPVGGSSVLALTVADSTGQLTALFYGRSHIAGVEPGAKIRLTGAFGIRGGLPGMINPTYELLSSA